jgi:hypothetical protein
MIRILTLLVSLFSFGLVDLADITYEIPVTDMLYFNDIPIAQLNNLTLNEIFEIPLSNHTTITWNSGGTSTITYDSNDNLIQTSNNTTFYMNGTGHLMQQNNQYYVNVSVTTNTNFNSIGIYFGNSSITDGVTDGISNVTYNLSFKGTYQNSYIVVGMFNVFPTTSTNIITTSYYNVYDLTTLGLTSLTKTQLDRYYELWLNPELNITYEINELDTQDLIILLASQSVWTIMIHLLYKYAYRPKKKSKRLGM